MENIRSPEKEVSLLSAIIDAIDSGKLTEIIYDETSRFNDATVAPVFEKLRREILRHINTSIYFKSSDELKSKLHPDSGDIEIKMNNTSIKLAFISNQLKELVRTIYANSKNDLNDKLITNPQVLNFNDIGREKTLEFLMETTDEMLFRAPAVFESLNFISEIGVFMESVRTLREPVPNKGFEVMLKTMLETPNYFAMGYPHDVLAFDSLACRKGEDIAGILAHKDICSTHLISSDDDLSNTIVDDDHILFQDGFKADMDLSLSL